MSEPLSYFLPAPPPAADSFATYQLAYKFHREVQQRQEFELYCDWYRQTAELHQKELQKMQGDINIFGWFCRRR